MALDLQDIPRVKTITKEDFIKHYFKPQKPVVIERYIEDWPAYEKWSLDYMKETVGDKIVPLYDDRPVDYKDGFNEPHAKMKMSEYIDLLKNNQQKQEFVTCQLLQVDDCKIHAILKSSQGKVIAKADQEIAFPNDGLYAIGFLGGNQDFHSSFPTIGLVVSLLAFLYWTVTKLLNAL